MQGRNKVLFPDHGNVRGRGRGNLLIPVGYACLLYDSSTKVSLPSGFGPFTSTVI